MVVKYSFRLIIKKYCTHLFIGAISSISLENLKNISISLQKTSAYVNTCWIFVAIFSCHIRWRSLIFFCLISGPPDTYISLGPCDRICRHCNTLFWYEERLKMQAESFQNTTDVAWVARSCYGGNHSILIK